VCKNLRVKLLVVVASWLGSTVLGAGISCDYYYRFQTSSDWGGTDFVGKSETFTQVDAQRSTTSDFAASAWWYNVGDASFWDNNILTGSTGTFYVRGRLKYLDAAKAPQEKYSNFLGPG
jgi:hypothetical protein